MAVTYKVALYNPSGAKQGELVNFTKLAYYKQRNRAGSFSFGLPASSPWVAQLADKWQVEIWRSDPEQGLPWYIDFRGIYREPARRFSGLETFQASGVGDIGLLAWRTVAYPAEVEDKSNFTARATEYILKTLVTNNHGNGSDGRHRSGTPTGYTITTAAGSSGGATLSVAVSNDNLLDALQAIVNAGGGDYDLIKTGATAWEFRYYAGQRGVDRSASLEFSTARGNMGQPFYRVDRIEEKTVAIVGGQGEGPDRAYVVRTGPNYSASNNIESFVDARGEDTTAGLQARGDEKLKRTRAQVVYGFDLRQVAGCRYGVHYCVGGVLGDKVGARYFGVSSTQLIDGVAVTLDPSGEESIKIETVEA